MKIQKKLKRISILLWLLIFFAEALLGFAVCGNDHAVRELGQVHISLKENSKKEISYLDAGEVVVDEKDITVLPDSRACYLKVALSMEGLNGAQQRDLQETLEALDDWEYVAEECSLYYKKEAQPGETVTFQVRMRIPEPWKENKDRLYFRIGHVVEAVESDYLNPVQTEKMSEAWDFRKIL